MLKTRAAITAVGAFLPETILDNKTLEQMVDTNDEWIVTRTGIKERRILKEPNKATAFMATKAAENLLQKAGLDPKEIDLIIVATATPDMPVVATAAQVITAIGATKAFGYDLEAACSGFLYGLSTASAYIESGRYSKVLLIGADMMSSIVNYEDRTTCVLFGDGAGAVLLEPNHEGNGYLDEYLRSDGVGKNHLGIEAGGSVMPASAQTVAEKKHYIYQDGQVVFKFAVTHMADAAEQIMLRNELTNKDVQYLVSHQANKRIIDATARRMGIVEEKVLMNIERYGNTTAATIPLLLNDYEDLFKKGDNIVVSAFGAGFTWGAALLKWAYNSKD
ncbi:MAG: beta-ketoacyl-ACP synthase III [Flavobacteriaceae bacterium]